MRYKLRFRLATLLGFVTVVCLLLALRSWWAQSASAQRAPLARLQALGPVNVMFQKRSILARIELSAGRLLGVDVCRVAALELDDVSSDGTDVARALQPFVDLTRLEIRNLASFDDEDLASLTYLANLHVVNLKGTGITDRSVEILARCQDLVIVELDDTKVTDRALQTLQELSALEMVTVSGTQVTAAGVAKFRAIRPDVQFSAAHIDLPELYDDDKLQRRYPALESPHEPCTADR